MVCTGDGLCWTGSNTEGEEVGRDTVPYEKGGFNELGLEESLIVAASGVRLSLALGGCKVGALERGFEATDNVGDVVASWTDVGDARVEGE